MSELTVAEWREVYRIGGKTVEMRLCDRIAELEAELASIHASAIRTSQMGEWYLDGVRRKPGVYVVMRVGDVPSDFEPAF